MHDQADELRQLVRERLASGSQGAAGAPLVVVSGGKGGVGATTVAANLAIALARQGRRAVFVDADLDRGGNAGLTAHDQRGSVVDVLAGRRSVHEVLERGPSGIQVLSGAWASGEVSDCSPAAQDRFIAELKQLAPHADVVTIDAGSSRNQFVRRLWQAASVVVVITTDDSTAIMNAYAAIKTLSPNDPLGTIQTLVNFSNDATLSDDVQARIATACRKFLALRPFAAGCIPPCAPADSEGVLVFPPRSEAARALDRVADRLWAQLHVDASRQAAARRETESTVCRL